MNVFFTHEYCTLYSSYIILEGSVYIFLDSCTYNIIKNSSLSHYERSISRIFSTRILHVFEEVINIMARFIKSSYVYVYV
jgi:hypothetical protein